MDSPVINSAQPDAETRDPIQIREMFNQVAARYDFANHLLSAGMDYTWRKRTAETAALLNPRKLLDVATGTGDLALAIQRRSPEVEVVGCDFSSGMLEIAKRKGVRETVIADAMALPFGDGTFDVLTIAFGLRNVADRSAALREFSRVLRQGGRLLVLDFSMPHNQLRGAYRLYLHHLLPRLAGFLTGARSAYEYLAESIEAFPSGAAMRAFIEANGFEHATSEPLTGGVVTLYTASKRNM